MTPWLDDGDVSLHHGDALEQLALMPSESVHCLVTSPPFWGLRDYGTGSWTGGDPNCDHSKPLAGGTNAQGLGKSAHASAANVERSSVPYRDACGKCGATRVDQQIGLEETPDAWCARLVSVFREARRVLRNDGVCWIEVGDTYASNVGGGTDGSKTKGGVAGHVPNAWGGGTQSPVMRPDNVKPKDLVGAPWLLAFALRADGWYLRSDTIWARPNPMPESVTDRPTKAHSYVFLLTKNARYFYDADSIREPHARVWDPTAANGSINARTREARGIEPNPAGANARSVWNIATAPTPFAHFATFPQALVERCIKAGTSEHGCCSECGAPWRRITEPASRATITLGNTPNSEPGNGSRQVKGGGPAYARWKAENPDVFKGWEPTCPCVVVECRCAESRTTHLSGVRNPAQAALESAAVLHEEVLVGAHGAQPELDARIRSEPEGLPLDPSPGASDGDARGLRDGAPHGDGGAPWTDADARRDRAPQERHQGRQPDRESGSRGEAGTRPTAEAEGVPDSLPALRRDDPSAAACPVCQGRLTPRPPNTVPCRVLDVFMGSGTTALVARRLGRHAIGIELNPEYLAIAAKRLEQLSLLA